MHSDTMCSIVSFMISLCFIRVDSVPSGLKMLNRDNRTENDFPFIAKLERVIILSFKGRLAAEDRIHICTSSVLTPMWTLTAGHCIDSAGPVRQLTDNLKIRSVIRYGGSDGATADIISSIHHPGFGGNVLNMQNDIGLVRTETIRIKQYAQLSPLDLNDLGGQQVTLASYGILSSPRVNSPRGHKRPLHVINMLIVRPDIRNSTALPTECTARRCVPSTTSTCSADSGGPLIHPTGILGVNSLSLENLVVCSLLNQYSLIEMKVITPVLPYTEWIYYNIKRDSLIF